MRFFRKGCVSTNITELQNSACFQQYFFKIHVEKLQILPNKTLCWIRRILR